MTPATSPGIAQKTPALGPAPINILNAPTIPDDAARPALDLSARREFAGGQPPSEGLPDGGYGGGESFEEPAIGSISTTDSADRSEVPEPQAAGMITSLMPFDRQALTEAVDQILGPFDGLVSSMPELRGPLRMVTASLAVAVTVLAVDVAVRLRRSKDEEIDPDGIERLVEFPGLPGLGRGLRP